MFNPIKRRMQLQLLKVRWKKKFPDTFTYPVSNCDISKITIGKYTYGPIDVFSAGCVNSKLTIGSYCSIAQDVRFILDGEHLYSKLSTYPFSIYFGHDKVAAVSKGPIIIDDDVWIGQRVTILSGVHIGQGAIIGAGSIVTKNVPPYAIFAGGAIHKYRFSDRVINKLIDVDFSKLSPSIISENLEILATTISDDNIDFILKNLRL